MNSLKIINEEIEKLKTILELDDVLCELSDNDYKFYNDKLQTLRQTKEELEVWEIVKKKVYITDGGAICMVIEDDDIDYEKFEKALGVKNDK